MDAGRAKDNMSEGRRVSRAELLSAARNRAREEEAQRAPRLVTDKRFVAAAASGGLLAVSAPVVANGDVLVLACSPYVTC
ncbi:type II/III secretion system family protein [Rubrobacter radiotolerans DSM 5868]|nr:type II/III secretion system family protein [Rubrobacter radiotolerans DSM 5868]